MRSHGVTLVDSIKPGVAKGSLYKEHESDGTISPAQAHRMDCYLPRRRAQVHAYMHQEPNPQILLAGK